MLFPSRPRHFPPLLLPSRSTLPLAQRLSLLPMLMFLLHLLRRFLLQGLYITLVNLSSIRFDLVFDKPTPLE